MSASRRAVTWGALCGLAAVAWPSGSVRAGELGEYDAACAKLDQEWKDMIMLAKKMDSTMLAAISEFNDSNGKQSGLYKQWSGKIKAGADTLVKWMKAQRAGYAKAWNAKTLFQELDPAIGGLEGVMDYIKNGITKGSSPRIEWGNARNGIPIGFLANAREAALAANLCFYSLQTGANPFTFDQWRTYEGVGL